MVRCPRCGFMIPEGETECGLCHRDVSRITNRPQPAGAHRYHLHDDEPAEEPRHQDIRYTGVWRRWSAGLLDLMFAAALVFAAKSACELLQYPSSVPMAILTAGVFYFFLLTPFLISSNYQASPGKIVFGIVVTDTCGKQVSFSRALFREISKYVSLLPVGLGFVMLVFTKKKQELHDLLALTVVTKRSETHLLMNTPGNVFMTNRSLFFGRIITAGVILCSLLVLLYFGMILHETITPQGIAAHSAVFAADSVADTNYPGLSLPLYDIALGLIPDDMDTLVKKVNVLSRESREAEAQLLLNSAMIAHPDDPVLVIATGDLMYSEGQYETAIQYYEKALSTNPKDANTWIRKGDAYLAISIAEMQGMREQFKTLTSGDADSSLSSDASTMDTFRSTESYRQAIKAYNEAITINPFTSIEITGRVLASTQALVSTYQGILDDIGIDNSTMQIVSR